MKPNQLIAITSDFGSELGCVGQMKGVILSINPRAQLCDVTHTVPPWDIHHASYVVEQSCKYFPKGTIHLAVVDPGVGTFRAGVIVQTETDFYIGPDNGLLSFLEDDDIVGIWRIENPQFQLPKVSATFHGRDVFGPAAAFLSLGVPPEKFGPPHAKLIRLSRPGLSTTEDGSLVGRVIAIDRFGNLITDIREEDLHPLHNGSGPAAVQIRIGQHKLPLLRTFADVPLGEALAFLGANDRVEIAVNASRADRHFGAQVGTRVEASLHERPSVVLRRTQALSPAEFNPVPIKRDLATELSVFFPTRTGNPPGEDENRELLSPAPQESPGANRRSGLFTRSKPEPERKPEAEPENNRKTTPYVTRRKKPAPDTVFSSEPPPPKPMPLPTNPIAERRRAYRAVAEEQRNNAAFSTPGYDAQHRIPARPFPARETLDERPSNPARTTVIERERAAFPLRMETQPDFEDEIKSAEDEPSVYEQSLLDMQERDATFPDESMIPGSQDYQNEEFFVEDDYFTTENYLDPEKYFNPDP